MEEWRDITIELGFSRYQVSSLGRLCNKKTMRISQAKANQGGYIRVAVVHDEGKTSTVQLHILVANTFIPNPDNKLTVDHINRIRNDNRVENLQWATMAEQSINKDPTKRKGRAVNQYTPDGNIMRVK